MSDDPLITITSLSDLMERLRRKYSGETPSYTSAARYPSSIIFFDSKEVYRQFLGQVPYERRYFSSAFPETGTPSGYALRRWLNGVLDEATTKPLVLVPLTEYLRLYQEGAPEDVIRTLFSKIVQAEGTSLIVPMLDYVNQYLQFFIDFIHQGRMAEVYRVALFESDESPTIRLILDRTGKAPLEDAIEVNDSREWFHLWEDGAIADSRTLMIRESSLIDGLSQTEIAVPKMARVLYQKDEDLLERFYSIDLDNLRIPVTAEVWERIFSALSEGGASSWEEIVESVLEPHHELTTLLSRYWEDATAGMYPIEQWFWLNEAKRCGVDGSYLHDVVSRIDTPNQLMDHLYLDALSSSEFGYEALDERRKILRGLRKPHFSSGIQRLEKAYLKWLEEEPRSLEQVTALFTNVFPYEQLAIVDKVIERLRNGIPLTQDVLTPIRDAWPAFAAYLDTALTAYYEGIADLVDDWQDFADQYTQAYVYAKLVHDQTTELLSSLQQFYYASFPQLLGAIKIGRLPTHTTLENRDHVREEGYLLLDAAGHEWRSVLTALFEAKGWGVATSLAVVTTLPSITAKCSLNEGWIEKFGSFDDLLHNPYRYPGKIVEELRELERIVDTIHTKYFDRNQPLWLISDHGATAFARLGGSKDYDRIKPEHGGRYCSHTGSKVAEKELVYLTKDGAKDFVTSLTYENLGPTSPKGEAHGGGTPEEILAIALRLIPPGLTKMADRVTIDPAVVVCSSLDNEITLQLCGVVPHSHSISLRVNNGTLFVVPAEWRGDGQLAFSLEMLRAHGLSAGENLLELTFDDTRTASCTVDLQSATKKTDFDDIFG